ncbi:MAG TPA: beta-eliminating lyase-related protein [Kofleriaceae bacterium]|nr:beta-eliminating lyase-related protein [Kofleriaceae bacterium]
MTPPIGRSLFPHVPARRTPRALLTAWLERPEVDALPDEPMAALERRVAELLGKEAALFFPTGTMAQQVALRIHAARRGRRAFAAHPQTHLDVWEQRGYSAVHDLWLQPVGDRHELMTAADLAALGEPVAAVIWELPQRDLGGQLPGWEELGAEVATARAGGAAAHMDGARLWEAQTFYRRPFSDIAGLFDSVYVSLYKGLQGLRGALLVADRATIGEAEVWRRRLGGALTETWPVAISALIGLDTLLPRMPLFREHAIAIAAALTADGVATVCPDPPQTPMFHVHLPAPRRAVERAGAAMLAEHGTRLFGRVRSSADPTRSSFEVSISSSAMELTPAEVAALVRELVERARAGAG